MKVTIRGLEDVETVLNNIAPRHARNLMRATVLAVASKARNEARKGAPVGRSKRLRRAIRSKRKNSTPDQPRAEVYVRSDAFYWRFLEYGTIKLSPRPFMLPAKERTEADKVRIVTEEFGKKLERALARAAK